MTTNRRGLSVADAQKLLDTLGPAWRVFHRSRALVDGEPSEPWWEGLAPAVRAAEDPDGTLVLHYEVVDGNTIYATRLRDLSVVESDEAGSILVGTREEGTDEMVLSTVTLTDSARRAIADYVRWRNNSAAV